MTSIQPPSTSGGSASLVAAATKIQIASATSRIPLASAASTSARLKPYVRPGVAGSAGEPGRKEREREREVVGEHVHRIREHRQASRQQASDDLDDREGRSDPESERERSAGWLCPRRGRVLRPRGGSSGSARSSHGPALRKPSSPALPIAGSSPSRSGDAPQDPRSRRRRSDRLLRRRRRDRVDERERPPRVHERVPEVAEAEQEADQGRLARAQRRQERLREQEAGRRAVPERHDRREVDREAGRPTGDADAGRRDAQAEREVALRRVRALRRQLRRAGAGRSSAQSCHMQARASDYVFTK